MKSRIRNLAGALMLLLVAACVVQAIVHPSELAIFILCLTVFIVLLSVLGSHRQEQ